MVAGICSEKEISPKLDDFVIVETENVIAPARVLFVGTPPLRDFSYGQMYHFAARAIEIVAERELQVALMTTTIHGVNYGLDAIESFQSLVHGFQAGLARHPECGTGGMALGEKKDGRRGVLKEAREKLGFAPPGWGEGHAAGKRGK